MKNRIKNLAAVVATVIMASPVYASQTLSIGVDSWCTVTFPF
jgi:hypothetical protein